MEAGNNDCAYVSDEERTSDLCAPKDALAVFLLVNRTAVSAAIALKSSWKEKNIRNNASRTES